MVFAALALAPLFLFWHGAGWLGTRFVARLWNRPSLLDIDGMTLVLVGLILTSMLAMCVAIFRPLSAGVTYAMMSAIVLGLALDRSCWLATRRQRWRKLAPGDLAPWAVAGFAAICFSALAIAECRNFDTGLYHAQAVRWLREWGYVPGLGNLHGRLAFNSSWFALSALCNVGPLADRVHHVINLVPIALGFGLAMKHLRAPAQELSTRHLFAFAVLVPCFFHRWDCGSFSPDLWAAVAFLLLAGAVIRRLELEHVMRPGREAEVERAEWEILLLSCYLPTVKLTVAPGAALGLFALLTMRRQPFTFVITALAGIALMVPFLFSNYLLSGYVVYPLPGLDLFEADWKIPHEQVVQMSRTLKQWVLLPGAYSWNSVMPPMRQWIGPWLEYYWRTNPQSLAMIAAFFPLQLLGLCLAFRRNRREGLLFMAVTLSLFLGLLYWFCLSPDPRYGLGWMAAGVAWPTAWLLQWVANTSERRKAIVVRGVFAIVLVVSLAALRSGLRVNPTSNLSLLGRPLTPLPEGPTRPWTTPEGLVIHIASDQFQQAWNAPLPSAPAPCDVALRGHELGNGFRAVIRSK